MMVIYYPAPPDPYLVVVLVSLVAFLVRVVLGVAWRRARRRR